ncbi:MAG TPA: Uma2 family endonuclease [Phototrophicaceae bacterium]|nr:Uma2 family endonuclease [Phototrophicaceae bacterium]
MVAQEKNQQTAELEIPGDAIAKDVSLEHYLEYYADKHYEYVEGWVIKMAPGTLKHNNLLYYLYQFFQAFFELKPIGQVIGQPFTLRLPQFPNRRREPDLMIVLKSNSHQLQDTLMEGAPDICIEIVSDESTARDYGDKFTEYEAGGVPEYWIFDSLRQETVFFRLGADGHYNRQNLDAQGLYRSPLLPGLALDVASLWQESFPGPGATFNLVKAMLDT